MPKIPVYIAKEQYPEHVADPENVGMPYRAIIQAEEGIQRQGLAMQIAGQTISGAVSRYVSHEQLRDRKVREAAQAAEYIERSARLTAGLGELGESYINDTGWQGKHEKFQQEARKLIDTEINNIKDPVVSLMVRKDAERLYAHHDLAVRRSASGQRIDAWKAQGLQALEIYEREEARAPDDLAAQIINSRRKATIAGMVQAGVIDQTTGFKLDQSLDERLAVNRVIQEMRVDPARVMQGLQAGRYENLTPERRESLIGSAQRQIEARDRQAEMALRRSVIESERTERQQEKNLREAQRQNYSSLAAGQASGKTSLADIDEALQLRHIDEVHYRQLLDRHRHDLEKEINEGEGYLRQTFKKTGPMAAFIDPEEEALIARLQKEFRDRVRSGEMPENVLNQIEVREQNTPRSPASYPTPLYLKGKKDDLSALEKAGQITKQKFESGEIDVATAKRELFNLKRLIESVHHSQQQQQKTETEKKESKSEKYLR